MSGATDPPSAPATTFTTARYGVNGTTIHCTTGGKGSALLLIHGFPQTSRAWDRVLPALARHHTLVVPDYRGAGRSSIPLDGYDKRNMAEDLHQLMQLLGHEHFGVVGHDVGAMIAYALAHDHPTAVERLILAEGLIAGLKPGFEHAMDNSAGLGSWFVTFNTVPDVPEALVTGRERIYLEWLFRNVAVDKNAITPGDVTAYVEAFQQPGALRAGFELYRAIFQDIADNQHGGTLTMPVLAVGGGGGVSVGDRLHRSLAPVAENLSGVLIPQCGHYLAEEKPTEFATIVLDFMAA